MTRHSSASGLTLPESSTERVSVDEAYATCKRITRGQGPNFSLGFLFLPRAKQDAIHAIYAFCRVADDIVDESGDEDPAPILDRWQEELELCYSGEPTHPVTIALADAAHRYPIPDWPLRALIDGCRDDLTQARYATFDDLLGYCEKVATTISVLSLSVFGATTEEAYTHGKSFSTALQLTNIIRDVGDDISRARIYIPLEELDRFGCSEEDILNKRFTQNFQALMAFQVERAIGYFDRAYAVIDRVEPDSRRPMHIMGAVYYAILEKIQRQNYPVFERETALNLFEKLRVVCDSYRRLGKGFGRG